MIRVSENRKRRQGGNAMMEFALAGSVLFVVMFGVADFARMFSSASVVASAARAGTQYGMMSPAHYGDYTGMQNAALADAQNASGLTITATQFCACSLGGTHTTCPATCSTGSNETYIQVTASMPFSTSFSYPGVPSTNTLTTTSVVRVQ